MLREPISFQRFVRIAAWRIEYNTLSNVAICGGRDLKTVSFGSGHGGGKAAIIPDNRKKWNAGWVQAVAFDKNKTSAELRPAEAYPKRKECF
jgi:hypothetical protein